MFPSCSKMYDNPRISCIFVTFLGTISWSFFDLMSGILRGVNGNLIIISMGTALAVTGCISVFPKRHSVKLSMIPKALLFGTLTTADLALYIFAQKYSPVGDVILLFDLNLLWTSIMDSAYRRAWPTKWQLISIFLALIGMILVVQPPFIFQYVRDAKAFSTSTSAALPGSVWWGHLMALLAGILFSVSSIIVSAYGAIDWTLWVTSQGSMCVALGIVMAAVIPTSQLMAGVTATTCLVLIEICIFEVVGRIAATIASQISPTLMTIIGVSQIPMTYTWSAIWLDEMLDGIKAFGVLCILMALAVILYATMKIDTEKNDEKEEKVQILDG